MISYLVAFLLVAYLLTILFVPPIIDKKFNTTTLLPPYRVSPQAQQVYDRLPFIADLHCDALLWKRNLLKRHDYGHVDIPRMLEAGMDLQAFTIVSKTPVNMNFDHNSADTDNITRLFIAQGRSVKTWFSLKERALEQCRQLYRFAEESHGAFRVITSAAELQQYMQDKQNNQKITAGLLGIEGMQVLEGNLANIDAMYAAGIRMMAPVHFFDNKIGGSAHGVNKGGLTDFGRQVIKRMEEKHMIVDLAHASPALIDDVLDMASRPVLVSHTGVKGTCNNIRNLSDAHLKRIAAGGGLIGIAVFEPAVCGTDAAATARAIKYTADLVGIEHVALGSDFDGAYTMHFDVTGLPLVVEELLKLGFNEQEIGLVMGGNVRAFLLQNLPAE
ncbi:MAG TPA: peptidase M19 [Flammeovirgaceae bacterium]|nr:peptidase M19 [Flammeovirgaceae bacterium]